MADVYSVIQGIHQASLLGIDGNFKFQSAQEGIAEIEDALKRDEGNPIIDSRVMSGFKVGTLGNLLKVSFQSECTLKEVHQDGFEDDISGKIEDIVSFLKKEYKKSVGETLKLKMIDEPYIDVQHMNATRTWVQCYCLYEIQSFDLPDEDGDQKRFEKSFKKWAKVQEK